LTTADYVIVAASGLGGAVTGAGLILLIAFAWGRLAWLRDRKYILARERALDAEFMNETFGGRWVSGKWISSV
jgi:hypothetical protein